MRVIPQWAVPDELESASNAAHKLLTVASQTPHFWIKHLIGSAIPFAFGVACAWIYVMLGPTSADGLRDVLTGILTFSTVLAGFMVTLMLFTGGTDREGLSSVQASTYVSKVTYLLFSQTLTLVVCIVCAVTSIGWLVFSSSHAPPWVPNTFLGLSFGTIALSALRMLMLPFQIFELHNFSFERMLEAKAQEQEAELEAALVALKESQAKDER